MHEKTLSQEVVKYIDYGSEEYVKQLMERNSNKKVSVMIPFVGVLVFPSADFQVGTVYGPAVQFQDSTYVGYMDMLLPNYSSSDNSKTAFSLLEFELDGVKRQFLQVSKPDFVSQNGTKFRDFVAAQYPKAGHQIPFNRDFMHTLTAIKVSGVVYQDTVNGFIPVQQGGGQFTSSLEFEMAISGYKLVLQ